jgi:hypothetical protein
MKEFLKNINAIKNKSIEALLDASKEVGLYVKARKLGLMFMSRHQTTGKQYS